MFNPNEEGNVSTIEATTCKCGRPMLAPEDEDDAQACPACEEVDGRAELDLPERKARRWSGIWPLDAYALSFDFREPVGAHEALDEMLAWAGEPPREIWP